MSRILTALVATLFVACSGDQTTSPGSDAEKAPPPAAAKSYTLTYFTMPG